MPTIQGRGYCKAAAFFRQSGCPAKQVARQLVWFSGRVFRTTGFSAGRQPNEKQQSESELLHTSIALAGDQ